MTAESSFLQQQHFETSALSLKVEHPFEEKKQNTTIITYSSFSNLCIMKVAFYFCLCLADIYKGSGLDQMTVSSKYVEFHKQFWPNTKVSCLLFCTYWWIWIIKTVIFSEFLSVMRGKEERNLILQNKMFFFEPHKKLTVAEKPIYHLSAYWNLL